MHFPHYIIHDVLAATIAENFDKEKGEYHGTDVDRDNYEDFFCA
jgi:hypothetical protein